MHLEIRSHVGIGPLRFGMLVDEIRRNVPFLAETFVKGPDSTHPTDAFDELGIHVYYRADGRCVAIEVGAPGSPTLFGKKIIGAPFKVVEHVVRGLDAEVEVDESGLTSLALGVAIYCPAHKDNDVLPVEGVLVFERGYYDTP